MLFLTSTSDIIQVITGSAGSISVHASYIDNTSAVVTHDRRNTPTITTATTTTVVLAPAASTYRNVTLLTVFNGSASVRNSITIQHYDGTNTAVLWSGLLAPYERVIYTDKGFQKLNANGTRSITRGPVSTSGYVSVWQTTYAADVQTFDTAGTYSWIKPTSFTPRMVMVKIWGGGGGGGAGTASASANVRHGATGGGGGAHATYLFFASELPQTVKVEIGVGGAGGLIVNAAGKNGGNTNFGTYLTAGGGGGGVGGISGAAAASGGAGGGSGRNTVSVSSTIGGVGQTATGSIGGQPLYNQATVTGGSVTGAGSSSSILFTALGEKGNLCAEFGGGAGAGHAAATTGTGYGGSSHWGGGGGGMGGSLTAATAPVNPGSGGTSGYAGGFNGLGNPYVTGYGADGGGTAGLGGGGSSNVPVNYPGGGDGGGGGGASNQLGVFAGDGGAGWKGAGGGGAGTAAAVGLFGWGGIGGDGFCMVVTI